MNILIGIETNGVQMRLKALYSAIDKTRNMKHCRNIDKNNKNFWKHIYKKSKNFWNNITTDQNRTNNRSKTKEEKELKLI